jgi:hypothetical protein
MVKDAAAGYVKRAQSSRNGPQRRCKIVVGWKRSTHLGNIGFHVGSDSQDLQIR